MPPPGPADAFTPVQLASLGRAIALERPAAPAQAGLRRAGHRPRGHARGPQRGAADPRPAAVTLPAGCPRLSGLTGEELDAELLARARRYPLAAGDEAIVARALAYPYVPPHESYVLGSPDLEGRHAVLAYGANGSPEVLRRKLGEDAELAVVAATLHDFELVFSSHISAYGAIPSTIHPAPGAAIAAFVLLVDDDQLVRLVESEFNYSVVQRLAPK